MICIPRICRPRSGFRTFILILCAFYLAVVFSFHSTLQAPKEEGSTHRRIRGKEAQNQDMFDDIRNRESLESKRIVKAYVEEVKKEIPDYRGVLKKEAKVQSNPYGQKALVAKVHSDFKPSSPKRDHEEQCTGPEVDEFVFRYVTPEVILFSAYWDTRLNDFDNVNGTAIIRIMAISRRGPKPRIACSFPGVDELSPLRFYEMCENHGRPWGGYILSCVVPHHLQRDPLCAVNVTVDGPQTGDGPWQANVSIRSLKPRRTPHEFATCVPPLFGNVGMHQLSEFIETSRILGSELITFYDFNVGDETRKVLEYYVNQGVVKIIPWMLPDAVTKAMWYYGQMLSIQDCLYRNMHSTRYVSFNDIDEFMVPHGVNLTNLADVVRVMTEPKTAGLSFISAFFDKLKLNQEDKDPKFVNFTSLLAIKRTRKFSNIRTKCMVRSTQVFEKGIHHVSKPIFADLAIRKVPESVAFLHHYRQCVANFGMDCVHMQEDRTMLRYESAIVENCNLARQELSVRLR